MSDVRSLEEDAVNFAKLATDYDMKGQTELAIFYYSKAAHSLRNAAQCGSQWQNIEVKAKEYNDRAEFLKNNAEGVVASIDGSHEKLEIEKARSLFAKAMEEDSHGNAAEAFSMYKEVAELCLKLRDQTNNESLKKNVSKLAGQALDGAESLKPSTSKASDTDSFYQPSTEPTVGHGTGFGRKPDNAATSLGPLGLSLRYDTAAARPAAHSASGGGGGGGGGGSSSYSSDEIQVLRTTSIINGQSFVPFFDFDANEKFTFPVPYTDNYGMLALSPKQRDRFGKWVRPDALCDNPQMIYAISSFSIRQTIVSDCSFVASLAISAQYERRFNKKLITSIIYPQNRRKEPQYNPCGKYIVKLNLNGVPRKVTIDDFLPMSKDGSLLCSFSNNRNELWVSMLEKAYMKVMGGYDFPGSNSNIDLHALTGWIPERIAIKRVQQNVDSSTSSMSNDEFNPDTVFKMLLERFHQGHCLMTVATGMLSDRDAERAGLVPTHAYALLDIRQTQGYRLFQLKNPWSHMRWRGNFSELDSVHWSEKLKTELSYDPSTAAKIDNGVFWIDYDSLMQFFDVFYINWDPELFPHTTCLHQMWAEGPKKDSYSIGQNPQFRLEVKATERSAVWILLTRHITRKEDFADNKEFITVLVYKTGGKRVYYPYDPPPYIDGVRINSPHYLCKMVVEPGTSLFTLVVSQYERNNTIYYTLRTYSTSEFKLTRVATPYNTKYDKQITGEWKGKSAGGCANYPETVVNNPTYQLKLDSKTADNHVLLELRGPKTFNVGCDVFTVSENIPNCKGSFTKKSSGDFRRGYIYMELEGISGGVYNIRPCTFNPNQEAPFFLNISSSAPVSISRLS